MAGRTAKSLAARRRRADEDGEDEEFATLVEDSQSEGSLLSEDADAAEDESVGPASWADMAAEGETPAVKGRDALDGKSKNSRKPRTKAVDKLAKGGELEDKGKKGPVDFKQIADTEAMMNGLEISHEQAVQEKVDFEEMAEDGKAATPLAALATANAVPNGSTVTYVQRQRQEHEEYTKKRDSDPTFIPNRGNFFMHDSRAPPNQRGFGPGRGAFAARGRGRTGPIMGGPYSPANQMAQVDKAAEQPWKHDLHETVVNEGPASQSPSSKLVDTSYNADPESARLFPKQNSQPQGHGTLNFSKTTLLGKTQMSVFLPGMHSPLPFEVPVRAYTRLPNHRPPLRRDKPVRIKLPGHDQVHQFPSPDRSFIFIPRQMRPNQHRGGYGSNRGYGGHGYNSRRTSMYGGSVYSASVAASRRSSIAPSRDNAFSPAGSFVGMPPPYRPVVRLPNGATYHSASQTATGPISGYGTPTGLPQMHIYPLPQQPFAQGIAPSMVHQPRPQKAISVTGIESPAALSKAPAPQAHEQQPFANQLPQHMIEPPAYAQQSLPQYGYSPHHQQSYEYQQPQAGTPLSSIPERAIHAQPYQPPHPYAQMPYYPQYPSQQQGYYAPYLPPAPNAYAPMSMYAPPPQQPYMIPPHPQPRQQAAEQTLESDGSQSGHQHITSQSGMVAHESNGMVFYLAASDVPQDQQQAQHYQPAENFVPSGSYAPTVAMPPTPGPEMGYYYPPVPPQAMTYYAPGPLPMHMQDGGQGQHQ